ncbi:RTA-like protein [Halenospora varia]|nr:RTA-like protein [Halenospora varia]
MSQNPWNSGGFQMQIICLILAPSFIAASIYLTLKHLVLYFGPEHSWLPARLYPWVFVGCDIGSIIIQAAGGGIAAAARNKNDPGLLNAGNNLMIAGIAFQVVTMALCGILVISFSFRYKKSKKTTVKTKSEYSEARGDQEQQRKLTIFCVSILLAYITILIRRIYRLPEMAGGWGNPLMQNEKEFLILDGI